MACSKQCDLRSKITQPYTTKLSTLYSDNHLSPGISSRKCNQVMHRMTVPPLIVIPDSAHDNHSSAQDQCEYECPTSTTQYHREHAEADRNSCSVNQTDTQLRSSTRNEFDVSVAVDLESDSDSSAIEISKEDVTTPVMKFNRNQSISICKHHDHYGNSDKFSTKLYKKRLKCSRSSSTNCSITSNGNSSDDDIQIISIKNQRKHCKSVANLNSKILLGNGNIGDPVTPISNPTQVQRRWKSSSWSEPHNRSIEETADVGVLGEKYEVNDSFEEYDGEEVDLVKDGIKQYSFFSSKDCTILEQMIDDQVVKKIDTFKSCTVDRAPLRNKYFFGEGYTYGTQMKRKGPGMEELYPKGFVDEIPEWIVKFVINPLENAGIIPKDFVNSCVINDYLKGGCIISHIDPKQLFDRPIYTISLMSDSALSFGVKFSFKPIRCSVPVYSIPLKRGCITALSGYAADGITHCVRPQDTLHRRAVIILRHVFDDAPRLSADYTLHWKEPRTPPANSSHIYHDRNSRTAPAHNRSFDSNIWRMKRGSGRFDEDLSSYKDKKRPRRSDPSSTQRHRNAKCIRQ